MQRMGYGMRVSVYERVADGVRAVVHAVPFASDFGLISVATLVRDEFGCDDSLAVVILNNSIVLTKHEVVLCG